MEEGISPNSATEVRVVPSHESSFPRRASHGSVDGLLDEDPYVRFILLSRLLSREASAPLHLSDRRVAAGLKFVSAGAAACLFGAGSEAGRLDSRRESGRESRRESRCKFPHQACGGKAEAERGPVLPDPGARDRRPRVP